MSNFVYAELELPLPELEQEEEDVKDKQQSVVILELSPTDEGTIQI